MMGFAPLNPSYELGASGQISMRKVDGWQTIATKPTDQLIDLAA
jgi:putative transposase